MFSDYNFCAETSAKLDLVLRRVAVKDLNSVVRDAPNHKQRQWRRHLTRAMDLQTERIQLTPKRKGAEREGDKVEERERTA